MEVNQKIEVEILTSGYVAKNDAGHRIAFEDHSNVLKQVFEKIDSDVVSLINNKAKGFIVKFSVEEIKD